MNTRQVALLIIAAALLLTLNSTLYIVDQTRQALVLQFGKPISATQTPGLHFKVPFVQDVEYYDNRLLDFNAEPKEVIAADQKRMIVDAFMRYRIVDPLRFKQAVAGDERVLRLRLNSILEASLKDVIGDVPLSDVVSTQRSEVMHKILARVNAMAAGRIEAEGAAPQGGFGIEVADVRIMRADLPQANSESIYRRMQTERERMAKEKRAEGAEDAQKIRSQADKERTILLAEARKTAEISRGEGDSQATKIFAQAVNQDPEFYNFYRSMQAYKKVMNKDNTTMILSPSDEFLQPMEKGAK